MSKVSVPVSSNFCPQTLFLYGTYKEDGSPNFGLFCWFSYCWDESLGVMACLGGNKLTKQRIKETGVFSANLVTEGMLPLADYFGNIKGFSEEKAKLCPPTVKGSVLDVPILQQSPWSFELEVSKAMELNDSDVFLCKIRNVLADESLLDETKTIEERLGGIAPVSSTFKTYFSWQGKRLGAWGEPLTGIK